MGHHNVDVDVYTGCVVFTGEYTVGYCYLTTKYAKKCSQFINVEYSGVLYHMPHVCNPRLYIPQ